MKPILKREHCGGPGSAKQHTWLVKFRRRPDVWLYVTEMKADWWPKFGRDYASREDVPPRLQVATRGRWHLQAFQREIEVRRRRKFEALYKTRKAAIEAGARMIANNTNGFRSPQSLEAERQRPENQPPLGRGGHIVRCRGLRTRCFMTERGARNRVRRLKKAGRPATYEFNVELHAAEQGLV